MSSNDESSHRREQDSESERPDLPDPHAMLGLGIGLGAAMVWMSVAGAILPVDPLLARVAAAPPAVFIFLGVPALFEQVYWRWHDAA